jgi:small subunit ribosomal protein S16
MLKIRLQRVGRKHEPTFRVVLTDSKNSTKSGRFLELLGSYDPRKSTEVFNGERIKEWMGKGAKLSDTMHNLLISKKIIEGKKINVLPRKTPPVVEVKAEEKPEVKVEEKTTTTEEVAEITKEVEAETPIELPTEEKVETEIPETPIEEVPPEASPSEDSEEKTA